ncbi:hypothetical protein [Sinomonas humi]|uniref:AbiEi antitoxin C-terminal domain-containing protein n=1 Tax=Sinomonas humi TaxID=1338436 RepID=A0A0B2ALW6_9MICC|nr:hypothetical protein [Sinomonas humi]KHL02780.1 hypothetical protein LK10_11470 [Sinomonas humi]
MDMLGYLLDTSRRDLLVPAQDPRRGFASGQLVRLRRGFYVPTQVWVGARPDQRFRMAVAAFARANPKAVFCGETALFLRGIPTVKAPPAIDVATTTKGRLGVGSSTFSVCGEGEAAERARRCPPPRVRRHLHSSLNADDAGEHLTVPLAEALVEVLATGKFPRALAVADGVLRERACGLLLDQEDVRSAIACLKAKSHRRRAELIGSLARAGAESPGESVSRALMHQFGFPEPILQKQHFDALGFVGRTDFFWDLEPSPVGEFDGWGKYFEKELTGGQDPREIIRNEKRRENRLLALGHPVIRWDWADLEQPMRLRAKLLAVGLRSAQRPVTAEKIA